MLSSPTPWPRLRLRWPLPALVGWLAAWAVFAGLRHAAVLPAFGAACAVGTACSALSTAWWRRTLVAAGFPLSALALGALPALPGWAWLLAVAPLLLAYPLRAWRDAPFFPTPANALEGLDRVVALPAGARVLDVGCGLGHGLRALHRLWPAAAFEGVEWSRPLAWGAAWRCRFARVRRADMWTASWADVHLLYLFQRPESMARAWAKAEAEMAPGSWFVSLEFEVPGGKPLARAGVPGARALWIYRLPGNSGSTGGPRRR